MESKKIQIFSDFESENEAEYRRRAYMTPQERMAELAALQAKVWGADWVNQPMDKTKVSIDWHFLEDLDKS
ncbi:MAG: hypothetical protein H6510_02885 [Acidobacteria bacterium]|nr:hypothetical protein [Acidobacteriota bacterium]